ncbi:endoglucanase 19-like [Wolffia australiana]
MARSMRFVLAVMLLLVPSAMAGHDYAGALTKSLLFLEAQRSGYLPPDQRVHWRSHSGLQDGKSSGVDLVGGYYDAGDNVKFGLPMAFTVTMSAWSIIEYGRQMAAVGELGHAMKAVRWGTDYLIKAHPEPNVLYGEVGDGNTDHYCWQRPEDMTTPRNAYRVDVNNPGSDLAGETAAAMAAAAIVFRRSDPTYSNELLRHATQLFQFADKYRGKYDSSIRVAQKYYGSVSGYADELLWAAAWMYQATNNEYYLDYLAGNGDSLGGTGWAMGEFGWDVKYVGAQLLVSKFLLQGKAGSRAPVFERYQQKAEFYMCACAGKWSRNVRRTPGGLLFRQRWNNLQFVSTAAFSLSVYADYLSSAGQRQIRCSGGDVSPAELAVLAKSQVDYILGDNPRATSYMVGYGSTYPQQVHHRGSSIVSIKVNPSFVSCRGGYDTWYRRPASDPNLLVGAIVGGPDAYDNFVDQRDNFEQTEPATYNSAPLLGVLARLHAGNAGFNQLLPVLLPDAGKPAARADHAGQKSVSSNSDSVFGVEQVMTASWVERGKTLSRYSVKISNKSTKSAKNLKLTIAGLYGPLWGLTKDEEEGGYRLPWWLKSIPKGKSLEFVYIHAASPAAVSVSGYTLE